MNIKFGIPKTAHGIADQFLFGKKLIVVGVIYDNGYGNNKLFLQCEESKTIYEININ